MERIWYYVLAGYLVLINVVAFSVYGADKRRARKDRWRVPEKTLFLVALIGGSLGALLGMKVFHHKTKHWYFRVFIPLILLVQIAVPIALWLHKNGVF
jgi:uncharacterized membrane protein YsdA (DUF1294 family)